MKIEVGKTYEHKLDDNEIAIVDSVLPGIKRGFVVTFRDNCGILHTMVEREFLEEYHVVEETETSKPAHYDTAIDTIAFAKANFSREQVEGFMRINAIKYLQRAGKKDDKMSDLRKSAHYLQMLIEMEEGK